MRLFLWMVNTGIILSEVQCGTLKFVTNKKDLVGKYGDAYNLTWICKLGINDTKVDISMYADNIKSDSIAFGSLHADGKKTFQNLQSEYNKRITVIAPTTNSEFTIRINSLDFSDAKTFVAQATFRPIVDTTSEIEDRVTLKVIGGPYIKIGLPEVSFINDRIGKSTSMSIELQGNPRPNVTWTFDTSLKLDTRSLQHIAKLYTYQYIVTIPVISSVMNTKQLNFTAKGVEPINGNTILNITSKPRWCGSFSHQTSINYNVTTNASLSIQTCGNPKPELTAMFDGIALRNTVTNRGVDIYQYTAIIENLAASGCGKRLTIAASNYLASDTKSVPVFFPYTPDVVNVYEASIDGSCIMIKWHKQNTGNCKLEHEVKLVDAKGKDLHSESVSNEKEYFKNCNKNIVSTVNATYIRAISKLHGQKKVGTWKDFKVSKKSEKDGNNGIMVVVVVLVVLCLIILIIVLIIKREAVRALVKRNKKKDTQQSGDNVGPLLSAGSPNQNATDESASALNDQQNTDKRDRNEEETELLPVDNATYATVNKPRPQQIYSPLGAGGGRGGERDPAETPVYSAVKVDAEGYPVKGTVVTK